jgi:hypothetical protein
MEVSMFVYACNVCARGVCCRLEFKPCSLTEAYNVSDDHASAFGVTILNA